MDIEIGNKKIDFVMQGGKAIYPGYIDDGLFLSYDFKGKSNTDIKKDTAYDLSGNGRFADLINFAYVSGSGYEDNVLKFDGVDDVINCGQINPLSSQLTYEFCIKVDSVPTDRSMMVFMHNATNCCLGFYMGNHFILTNGPNQRMARLDTLKIGDWNDILITYNNLEPSVFINGVETLYEGAQRFGANDSNILSIGSRLSSSPVPFSGEMGNFLLYNKILSSEEITHNYNINKERFGI